VQFISQLLLARATGKHVGPGQFRGGFMVTTEQLAPSLTCKADTGKGSQKMGGFLPQVVTGGNTRTSDGVILFKEASLGTPTCKAVTGKRSQKTEGFLPQVVLKAGT